MFGFVLEELKSTTNEKNSEMDLYEDAERKYQRKPFILLVTVVAGEEEILTDYEVEEVFGADVVPNEKEDRQRAKVKMLVDTGSKVTFVSEMLSKLGIDHQYDTSLSGHRAKTVKMRMSVGQDEFVTRAAVLPPEVEEHLESYGVEGIIGFHEVQRM